MNIHLAFALILPLAMLSSGCGKKISKSGSKNEGIKWVSYDEAVKLSKKHSKKVFIDVYTDWCGWCKQLDKTTFQDPEVIEYVNSKYYAVKLNAEGRNKVMYNGYEITEQELCKRIYGVTGYPTSVYLDKNQKVLQVIPGYLEAGMFKKVLRFFGEDHYTTTTWEQYQHTN